MKHVKTVMAAAFLTGAVTAAATAYAATHTITEKGKVFSVSEITVKKGDTLNFVNDDKIVHNVMSTTTGNEFNVGAVKPGIATPVTFKNVGDVLVICAIHPSMKLHVKVVE